MNIFCPPNQYFKLHFKCKFQTFKKKNHRKYQIVSLTDSEFNLQNIPFLKYFWIVASDFTTIY